MTLLQAGPRSRGAAGRIARLRIGLQRGEDVPAAILMRNHFFSARDDLFVLRTGRGMQTSVAPVRMTQRGGLHVTWHPGWTSL
jgi:hypothetical protein